MGMSTHIQAFIPDTDNDFQKHKEILLLCNKNGVSLPKETSEYFNCQPDESMGTRDYVQYLIDKKLSVELGEGIHYVEYSDDSSSGFEVELSKLPQGVTKLRFCNSW